MRRVLGRAEPGAGRVSFTRAPAPGLRSCAVTCWPREPRPAYPKPSLPPPTPTSVCCPTMWLLSKGRCSWLPSLGTGAYTLVSCHCPASLCPLACAVSACFKTCSPEFWYQDVLNCFGTCSQVYVRSFVRHGICDRVATQLLLP